MVFLRNVALSRRVGLLLGLALLFVTLAPVPAGAQSPVDLTDGASMTASEKIEAIYGEEGLPATYVPAAPAQPPARPGPLYYFIMRQGNDSNCDFISFSNGVSNVGGDGEYGFWFSRSFIPQDARDFREGYYTQLGPNGSDQPFSVDNLGAAPEAFIGAYEAFGFNAVMMASTPGIVDVSFAQAIYNRLAVDPAGVFAHVWITPVNYDEEELFENSVIVPETGEEVHFPFPYHEITVMAAPDRPNYFVVLDGLVGYPYAMSLQDMAARMRGFNRVIVASRHEGGLEDHQRFQLSQMGQPYVDHPLGGLYLRTARVLWGPSYQQWGSLISPAMRAPDDGGNKVVAYGNYVRYERMVDSHTVVLSPLGWQMAFDVAAAGLIDEGAIAVNGSAELPLTMHTWATEEFGSLEHFHTVFGRPITEQFWLSPDQMKQIVLRGLPQAEVDSGAADGYIAMITERAMVAWHPATGAFLVPLGQVSFEQTKAELFAATS